MADFFLPEDAEPYLAAARLRRNLTQDEKSYLYGNYLSVKRSVRSKPGGVDKVSFLPPEKFRDFVRWSLENGFESGKVLAPDYAFKIKGWRLAKKDEHEDEVLRGTEDLKLLPGTDLFTVREDGHSILFVIRYRWVTKTAALRSRFGLSALNGRGLEIIKKRRRTTRKLLCAFGESKSLSAWAADPRAVVSDKIIKKRMKEGWTAEDAITAPPSPAGRPKKTKP